jgi:Ankyrin repeats (many copies)
VVGFAFLCYRVVTLAPVDLMACVEAFAPPLQTTCKAAMFSPLSPNAAEVADLNRMAGAVVPLGLTDDHDADAYLKHLIAAGLDVNAHDRRAASGDMTALHASASGGEVRNVRILLANGADRDVLDARGRTPLDLARFMNAKTPTSGTEQVIDMLSARKP